MRFVTLTTLHSFSLSKKRSTAKRWNKLNLQAKSAISAYNILPADVVHRLEQSSFRVAILLLALHVQMTEWAPRSRLRPAAAGALRIGARWLPRRPDSNFGFRLGQRSESHCGWFWAVA